MLPNKPRGVPRVNDRRHDAPRGLKRPGAGARGRPTPELTRTATENCSSCLSNGSLAERVPGENRMLASDHLPLRSVSSVQTRAMAAATAAGEARGQSAS